MKIIIDGKTYLSMKDVLELLGWKEHRLYTESREGRMPKPIKLEERSFWEESEIDEYLEKTREKT